MSERPTLRSLARTVWGVISAMVTEVFVEPVREGRIKVGWPAGLRPIAFVGIVGFVIALVLMQGAGIIRGSVEITDQLGADIPPQPRAVLWITFALTALSISLGLAGALHSRVWVRWSVTSFSALVLLLASTPDFSWVARGYSILAGIGLLVFVALRGRYSFRWWEFVVFVGIVFSSFAVSIGVIGAGSLPFGYDFIPIVVSLVIVTIGQLALPAALATGAAVAELAAAVAVKLVTIVRDRLGVVALCVVLGLVVLWRVWDAIPFVATFVEDPAAQGLDSLAALLFLAAVAGSWVVLRRLRRGSGTPTSGALIATLAGTSLLIAVVLTPTALAAVLQLAGLVGLAYGAPEWVGTGATWVGTLSTDSTVIGVTRVAAAIALIVVAVVLARRGRRVLPELLVAIAATSGMLGLSNIVGMPLRWSPQSLAFVATVAAVVIGVWMLVVRTATVRRLAAVTAALLISALFANPQILLDPITFIGLVSAGILVGLVWSFLTGFAIARQDSLKYPLPSRVMLVLASSLFTATVIAYSELSRDPDAGINLTAIADLGSVIFGDALLACALIATFVAAIRDRELE